jgi:hypothetical protein
MANGAELAQPLVDGIAARVSRDPRQTGQDDRENGDTHAQGQAPPFETGRQRIRIGVGAESKMAAG